MAGATREIKVAKMWLSSITVSVEEEAGPHHVMLAIPERSEVLRDTGPGAIRQSAGESFCIYVVSTSKEYFWNKNS